MPGEQVSRDHILRAFPAAARSKNILEAAVLDAAFDVLLQKMYAQGLFREFSVVFKGGTALRKLRFGHKGRFSFDLDFDGVCQMLCVSGVAGGHVRAGAARGI